MFDLITLGEILLRFSTEKNQSFLNASSMDLFVGGAELNVASIISQMGGKSACISELPSNAIGEMARRKVLEMKVDDEYILSDSHKDARLGLYYFESANSPRKPEVIYDRCNSSFRKLDIDKLPQDIWYNTRCFHTSGINLALGKEVREFTVECIKRFKKAGATISFDVNFRGNLWTGEEARKSIEKILPYVDIFFCSEDTARYTFNKTGNGEEIARSFALEYDLDYICQAKRTVHSARSHSFGSMIYDCKNDEFYKGMPYQNIDVLDRIGSGDAFVGGALYGLICENSMEKAVKYGNASAAIKSTIAGDISQFTRDEVCDLIASHEEGDHILVEVPKNTYAWVTLDEALGESLVYITGKIDYIVPLGEKKLPISPRAFEGKNHNIRVRYATDFEINAYQNLALNVNDQHENVNSFPHASANVETRGESVFAARNAIDGLTANSAHGIWPFSSWGINRDPKAVFHLDFGRKVKIDKLVIYLRVDFPHDSWWNKLTVKFSDETTMDLNLEKTDQGQEFSIEEKTIEWLELYDLKKVEDDSPFPALTQLKVYGKNLC